MRVRGEFPLTERPIVTTAHIRSADHQVACCPECDSDHREKCYECHRVHLLRDNGCRTSVPRGGMRVLLGRRQRAAGAARTLFLREQERNNKLNAPLRGGNGADGIVLDAEGELRQLPAELVDLAYREDQWDRPLTLGPVV